MIGRSRFTLVVLTAVSARNRYEATAPKKGKFLLSVAPGTYDVLAYLNGHRLEVEPFSYEGTGKLNRRRGQCAQIAFVGSE